MDGRRVASTIVRHIRREKALSQRELARLARVPQPTISEVESARREPSITLLSKIAESAGFALDVRLVPLPRNGAIATARRISERLGANSNDDQVVSEREDAALRAIIDLRDALRRATEAELHRLVASPPSLIGQPRWDAFLAGIVEDECARRDLAPPTWVEDDRRFLTPPWFLSENPELHQWEAETSPAALARHGVLAAEDELEAFPATS